MITVFPYDTLGQADYGWLQTHYHFSFSTYHNPERMGFGLLRVINDDVIAPHSGFDTHPHRDMEIITYVRSGAITHRDSRGNEGTTRAGDVQVMSAGSGITHSEHNETDEVTRLFQIWIHTDARNHTPRWDAQQFPKTPVTDQLQPLASGREENIAQGALMIHQDATLFGGRMRANQTITQPIRHQAYLLVADGQIEVDGTMLNAGDGAEITNRAELSLHALHNSELLLIDVPATA